MERRYGIFKKTIAVIMELVCMVTLVVSVYVLMFSFDRSVFQGNGIGENDYFDTEFFQNESMKEIKKLMYYCQLKNNFETDGFFDDSKIVDLKDYIENDVITGQMRNKVAYSMRDLLDWGKAGLNYENTVIMDNAGNESKVEAPIERYLTVEDRSLMSLYRTGIINTVDEYNQMKDYLDRTIRALPNDINTYKEQNTKFKSPNTNLRYTIICGKSFYTNMELKDKQTVEELKKTIQDYGAYMYINSNTLAFESNIGNVEIEMYRYIDSLKSFDNMNYTIFIAVDKSLPAQDALYTAYEKYQSIRPWFWTCVASAFFSIIGLVVSFAYCTVAAGYREGREKVYLNFFDKIYTEVAIIILLLLGVFAIYEGLRYFRFSFDSAPTLENIVALSVLALALDACFFIAYLSLIRRRRAGTLSSNSLFTAITTPVKTAIGSKVITVRVFVSYTAAIVVFLLLAFYGFYHRNAYALIVLALAILYVGAMLIKSSFLRKRVIDGAAKIADGDIEFQIDTKDLKNDNLLIAEIINEAGSGISRALEEQIRSEKLQADIITNVSHDLKTPLTSIVNYVDLLKRENIDDPKIQGYIKVLDEKSLRLKHLTEDLVEASKISAGNIELHLSEINFNELINQTEGEFVEKFETRGISLYTILPEHPIFIMADGMRIWRVIENLYNNVAKYALPNTRVYVNLLENNGIAELTIKNISAQALNIKAEELTERFIRGDISRSTEGSGLGLAIAKNLTQLQGGKFDIYLDGDLFKVTVSFPIVDKEKETDKADNDKNEK